LTFTFDLTLLNGATGTETGSLGGDVKAESHGNLILYMKVPKQAFRARPNLK
jgi:hypothetical protein